MCDGVGLSFEEAANEQEFFTAERRLNMELLRKRIRGTRFLWGREGRRSRETANAALLLYLPRREAAAGGDPEALHSARAEGPTRTWDTPNACVFRFLLFPAPAHRNGYDVIYRSYVVENGNLPYLLRWPRLQTQPFGFSSLAPPHWLYLTSPFFLQVVFAHPPLLKNS